MPTKTAPQRRETYHLGHVRRRDLKHRLCSALDSPVERISNMLLQGRGRRRNVQLDICVGKRFGRQRAKRNMSIGDRRMFAAA